MTNASQRTFDLSLSEVDVDLSGALVKSFNEMLEDDTVEFDAGKDVSDEGVKTATIGEGQLAERVQSQCLNHQRALTILVRRRLPVPLSGL